MTKLRFSRKTLCIPYAVFLLFFVIAPMLVIVFYAFTDRNNHFSFINFAQFFSDPTKISTIVYSIVIALITTVVCLLLAYPVAYILARSKMKKKTRYLTAVYHTHVDQLRFAGKRYSGTVELDRTFGRSQLF